MNTVRRQIADASRVEVEIERETVGAEAALKRRIDRAKSINAVTDLMLHPDTQKTLSSLPQRKRDEIRDQAKARLVALGWPSKKAA